MNGARAVGRFEAGAGVGEAPRRWPEQGCRGDSVALSRVGGCRPRTRGRERPGPALPPENSSDRGPYSASVAQTPTSYGIADHQLWVLDRPTKRRYVSSDREATKTARSFKPADVFEVVPMWWPRCISLILIAAVCSYPSARGSQAVERRAKAASVPGVDVTAPVVLSAPVSRRESISPFTPIRIRRKAVLEQTHTQIADNLDLGPVPSPSPFLASLPVAPMPCLSFESLPLRC